MKLIYPAVFTPGTKEEGGYWVMFPDLPGCFSQGETLEEAFENAIEAADLWLDEEGAGAEYPLPSRLEDIAADLDAELHRNAFVNYILLDTEPHPEAGKGKLPRNDEYESKAASAMVGEEMS